MPDGYVMNYYPTDLKKLLLSQHATLNLDQKLELCSQVCEGMVQLYEKAKLRHSDIKPENIFIEYDSNGKFQLRMGDLDGAGNKEGDNNSFFANSKTYSHDASVLKLREKNIPPEFEDHAMKQDLFSGGIVLYKILTNQNAHTNVVYGTRGMKSGDFVEAPLREALKDLPPARASAIFDLIKKMCSFKSTDKMTLGTFKAMVGVLFKSQNLNSAETNLKEVDQKHKLQ